MAALTAALMASQAAGAIGSYTQQRRDAGYDAAIAGENAQLSDQQAAQATARGAQLESQSRAETRQVLGSQRAGYGASGVDVGTGSAVDVYGDTARVGELDAMTIRNNAALEAYGYKVQGSSFRAQQQNAQQRGKDAWTTLLTGGAQAFGSYAAGASSGGGQPPYAQWGRTIQAGNLVSK